MLLNNDVNPHFQTWVTHLLIMSYLQRAPSGESHHPFTSFPTPSDPSQQSQLQPWPDLWQHAPSHRPAKGSEESLTCVKWCSLYFPAQSKFFHLCISFPLLMTWFYRAQQLLEPYLLKQFSFCWLMALYLPRAEPQRAFPWVFSQCSSISGYPVQSSGLPLSVFWLILAHWQGRRAGHWLWPLGWYLYGSPRSWNCCSPPTKHKSSRWCWNSTASESIPTVSWSQCEEKIFLSYSATYLIWNCAWIFGPRPSLKLAPLVNACSPVSKASFRDRCQPILSVLPYILSLPLKAQTSPSWSLLPHKS